MVTEVTGRTEKVGIVKLPVFPAAELFLVTNVGVVYPSVFLLRCLYFVLFFLVLLLLVREGILGLTVEIEGFLIVGGLIR